MTNRSSVTGDTMIQDYKRRRLCFLLQALDDAKRWCPAPDRAVGRSASDQLWLQLFSSPSETVTPVNVQQFLAVYRLSRQGQWNLEAVADLITKLRGSLNPAIRQPVTLIAEELRSHVARGVKADRQQTSAASKIGFFMEPGQEIYIWDQFVTRSARFRDWVRAGAGTKPRQFARPYSVAGAAHDYGSFHASCAKALQEERQRPDFAETVQEFRDFLERVGGPMAAPSILRSSFVERRVLDKLMFWEGRWVKDWKLLQG